MARRAMTTSSRSAFFGLAAALLLIVIVALLETQPAEAGLLDFFVGINASEDCFWGRTWGGHGL